MNEKNFHETSPKLSNYCALETLVRPSAGILPLGLGFLSLGQLLPCIGLVWAGCLLLSLLMILSKKIMLMLLH